MDNYFIHGFVSDHWMCFSFVSTFLTPSAFFLHFLTCERRFSIQVIVEPSVGSCPFIESPNDRIALLSGCWSWKELGSCSVSVMDSSEFCP